MKKLWVLVFLVTFLILSLMWQSTNAAGPKIGLLFVYNYSGIDSVGSNKLVKTVGDLFVDKIQKQSKLEFLDQDQTEAVLKQAQLDLYYQADNLCSEQDIAKIGQKVGLTQLVILEVNGYNEIKREKSKKSYQLLVGLKAVNCQDGSTIVYSGEGFSESGRDQALDNAITQLANNYLNLQADDPNSGSIRGTNIPVIGNQTSKMYHLGNTHHQTKSQNQVQFNSRNEAEKNLYKPCPICFPTYKSFAYSDRDLEESFGREACGTIEYYYREGHNPEALAKIQKVADRLLADTTRKNYDFHFRLLDSNEVNAFAAPNGYIYITQGLLDVIESDDELALVIAHEMGHIEKKHGIQMYKKAQSTAVLASILLAAGTANSSNSSNDQAAVLLAVIVTNIVVKGYSREHELEADQISLAHLKNTGFDHESYQTLMGRFIDMRAHKIYAIDKLFLTHPTPEKRIESLDKFWNDYQSLQLKLQN